MLTCVSVPTTLSNLNIIDSNTREWIYGRLILLRTLNVYRDTGSSLDGRYNIKILLTLIILIITRNLYCATKCMSKLRGAGLCTSAKRMTSILMHVAEAFPSARLGTIRNSHWVIGIATNTSMVLNCALVTYTMMTADVGQSDAL